MDIYVKNLRMVVDGAGPGVRRILQMTREKRTGRKTKRGFPEIERTTEKLYRDISPTRLVTMTGLLPRILKWSRGTARVHDTRPGCTRVRMPDDVSWRHGQKEALEAMLGSPQGLMVYPTGFGKTFLLEQVCRVLSDKVIVVCSTRRTVLKELVSRLAAAGVESRVVDGSHKFRDGFPVYVVSDRSLHKLPEGWEPDIFIYDEAHGAAAPTVFPQMQRFQNCRLYGFTATPEGRSDKSDRGVEALFGEYIGEMTYQEAEAAGLVAPMHVYFMDIHGDSYDHFSDTDLNLYGYVMNGVRNETLLAGADAMLAQGFSKQLFATRNTRHTLILSHMSPDIIPVYSPVSPGDWAGFKAEGLVDDTRHSQAPDIDAILGDMRRLPGMRIAGTTCMRDGVDISDLNVVVRMDGLSGRISNDQFSGRGTRTGKDLGLILDSTDRFGSRMENASGRRMGLYREKGWSIYRWGLYRPPEPWDEDSL